MFKLLRRKKQDTKMSVVYDFNFESKMHVWKKPTEIMLKC